jgi:hypothetical protein
LSVVTHTTARIPEDFRTASRRIAVSIALVEYVPRGSA